MIINFGSKFRGVNYTSRYATEDAAEWNRYTKGFFIVGQRETFPENEDHNCLIELDENGKIIGVKEYKEYLTIPKAKEAIKEYQKEVEDFFSEVGCYNHSYSDVTILNASKADVLAVAREYVANQSFYPNFSSVWMDGKIEEDGAISFVGYREGPGRLAKYFSLHLPDAIVYSDTSWDYHFCCCYKNGEVCNDFSARWREAEPEAYEDELEEEICYDCDLVLTDHMTGHEFYTGGMCSEEEYKAYCKLIEEHPPVAPAKKRGL